MFDITPYLWPDDPWLRIEPTGNIRACYRFKHTIGMLLQPSSILEIGVRAGYTAAAFLAACPQTTYYGVDADNGQHGGVPGAVAWARSMFARHFPGRSLRIDAPLDTRQQAPAGSDYDLAHVDGDHSFAGCVRDLELAERLGCKWILVDDIDYLPPVRQAVELFIGRTGYRHVFLPSFRGDCLIRTRAGDDLRVPDQRRSAATLSRPSLTTATGRSLPDAGIL
jgi:Methyltransferase domain